MSSFPAAPNEARTLEVLARIKGGDDTAWDELYRRYHDELLFVVRTKLGSRLRSVLESEDVLQSVALEAFQALPRFEHRGEGSLRRFLHTLVVNKIRDRADTWRAEKRDGSVPLTDQVLEITPQSEIVPTYYDERYERLERVLATLPDDMREVLVLRKMEGHSSKEVAELVGKSDAAVRKLYSRGLARLSTQLGARGSTQERDE